MEKIFELTNSLNLKLLIFLTSIATIQSLVQFGIKTAIITFVPCIFVILLIILAKRYIKNRELYAILFSCILMCGVLGFSISAGGANHATLLVCSTVVMSSLYMNEKVIKNYFIILDIVMIVLFGFFKIDILEKGTYFGTYITHMIILIVVEFGLYTVVSWANESFKESESLLKKVQNTITIVEESNGILTESVSKLEVVALKTNDVSKTVGDSMEEINDGISLQNESINIMNDSMDKVRKEAEDTKEISKKNEMCTSDLSVRTSENLDGINLVENQIEIIRSVIKDTTLSVDEFYKSIEDIIEILNGIRVISEQTNLLALNASIESARAGIHGKGFSVVAEEVRKLSDESNDVVEDVEKLVLEIKGKLENLSVRVESGYLAAEKGKEIIGETRISFTKMNEIFKQTKENITDEYEHIGKINMLIDNVNKNVEEINNSVEISSFTTKKVTKIQEDQQLYVGELLENLRYIKDQIENLKNVL